jgi:hypothetical protein
MRPVEGNNNHNMATADHRQVRWYSGVSFVGSMRSGGVSEAPQSSGEPVSSFCPENDARLRGWPLFPALSTPHNQAGDGFSLAQLIAVHQNWVVQRCDLVGVGHHLRLLCLGPEHIWPPRSSISDFPFSNMISQCVNVTRPVIDLRHPSPLPGGRAGVSGQL